MSELSLPLTDEELNKLDAFLMERLSEEQENSGTNSGVLDICELDGFFTALVSGPDPVTPSQWLPAIWGDYEPDWDTLGNMGDVVAMMIRHMNGISKALLASPEEFRPLFFEQKIGEKYYTIVDEWCQGYAKGVSLTAESWEKAESEVKQMLAPIFTFVGQEAWDQLDRMRGDQVDELQRMIPPAVRDIYLWWMDKKKACSEEQKSGQVVDLAEARKRAKLKHHDDCPCGSGRQYRHCCLH